MSFSELINGIIENTKERIKNPLIGAFTLSLILYNWRPLLYLVFSDASIEIKIEHINSNYPPTWETIVWPIVITFILTAFTLASKYIMWGVDKMGASGIEGRIVSHYAIKKSDLKEKREIAGIEYEIKHKRSGSKQIEDFTVEINSLKGELDQQKELYKIEKEDRQKETETYINEKRDYIKKVEETNNQVEQNRRILERAKFKYVFALSNNNIPDVILQLLNDEELMSRFPLNTFNFKDSIDKIELSPGAIRCLINNVLYEDESSSSIKISNRGRMFREMIINMKRFRDQEI